MNRLIVHQPYNFESRHYRYYNIFFNVLTDKLKQKFDVLENRYFKFANNGASRIQLLHTDTHKEKFDMNIYECEMIIENYETKKFKALSFFDLPMYSEPVMNYKSNEYFEKVLVAQFDRKKIHNGIKEEEKQKISPWVYFPIIDYDFDKLYNIRKHKTDFIDKLYFRGSVGDDRRILKGLSSDNFTGPDYTGDFNTYSEELLNYKIGLSVAGMGEFCYRDIEYMAMGIPFMRFEYNNEMAKPLIPNYHYISIPRPEGKTYDSELNQEDAVLFEQKFNEVKNDTDFLNFVAKNSRDYYNKYIKLDNCVNYTMNLLGMDKWM
jgi:hypothetical protein